MFRTHTLSNAMQNKLFILASISWSETYLYRHGTHKRAQNGSFFFSLFWLSHICSYIFLHICYRNTIELLHRLNTVRYSHALSGANRNCFRIYRNTVILSTESFRGKNFRKCSKKCLSIGLRPPLFRYD